MGTRILYDENNEQATLYCSTTDWSFGPVVNADHDKDPRERLEAFLTWLTTDPRSLNDSELHSKYYAWLAQETEQYARERLATLERDEEDQVILDHEVAELAALRARFENK